MIPILYERNVTDFTTLGLGKLVDAISCDVTDEKNGEYSLVMEYPTSSELFRNGDLVVDRIIGALAHDDDDHPQGFRISKVDVAGDVATVTAEHVSYQLNWIVFKAQGTIYSFDYTYDLMQYIFANSVGQNPFTINGGMFTETTLTFSVSDPQGVRGLLVGEEGSMIQLAGGDLRFDNYKIIHAEDLGVDNGVRIVYGKNIVSADQQVSIDSIYNAALPYWKATSTDGNVKTVFGSEVEERKYTTMKKVVPIDVSSESFIGSGWNYDNPPSSAQVTTWGRRILKLRKPNLITPSINVDFVPLWQTLEYKEIADLEKIHLFDTVTVSYSALGIESKAKVVRTVFDVLNERYKEITVGRIRSTLASKIAKIGRY